MIIGRPRYKNLSSYKLQNRVMWKEQVYQMSSLGTSDANDSDDSTSESKEVSSYKLFDIDIF